MQIRFPGMTCVVCGQPLPPGSEAEVHPNLKGPQGGKKYYHAEHGAQRNPSRAASRRAKARASGRRKRGGERFQGETESFQTKKEIIDSILGGEEGIGWTTSKEKRERRRNLQWYGKEDLMEQFFGVPRGPRSSRNNPRRAEHGAQGNPRGLDQRAVRKVYDKLYAGGKADWRLAEQVVQGKRTLKQAEDESIDIAHGHSLEEEDLKRKKRGMTRRQREMAHELPFSMMNENPRRGAQGNPKVRTSRRVHKMSDDEFDRKYEPLNSPSGDTHHFPELDPVALQDGSHIFPYWTAQEIQGQKKNYVWTVLDVDDELYVVPGIHRVNQFAFMVTRKPWKDKNIEVKWT